MPTKIKYDRAAILAAYEACKSQEKTAAIIGCHVNTVYAAMRDIAGKCIRCGSPAIRGKKQCKDCYTFDRERIKTRRRTQREAGLCQLCNNPVSKESSHFCDDHRKTDIDWRRKNYHEKQKFLRAEQEANGTPYWRRHRYGQSGWQKWLSTRQCEGCGVSWEEGRLDIHHIDENKNNNSLENLATLCFTCHKATHELLKSQSPKRLYDWFFKTYPNR